VPFSCRIYRGRQQKACIGQWLLLSSSLQWLSASYIRITKKNTGTVFLPYISCQIKAALELPLAQREGTIYLVSSMLILFRAFEEYERDYKKRTAGRSPTEEESAEYKEMIKTHRKNAWNCLGKTSILLVFAVACNTMMVFSILTIQHCHHEVLLGLYWPLWTFLGLGSNIAMAGVLLSQCYGLSCQELPPYGTALGTPVLVVCSIGHFLYSWIPHKFGRGSKSQNV